MKFKNYVINNIWDIYNNKKKSKNAQTVIQIANIHKWLSYRTYSTDSGLGARIQIFLLKWYRNNIYFFNFF